MALPGMEMCVFISVGSVGNHLLAFLEYDVCAVSLRGGMRGIVMGNAVKKKNRFTIPIRVHRDVYPNEITGFVETRRGIEDIGISKGLRYLFLIHGVFFMVVGLSLYFVPVAWIGMTGSVAVAQAFVRVLGAFFVALGFKDILCFRAGCWKEVCITVLMEAVFSLLASIGTIFLIIFIGVAPGIVATALVFGIFALAWSTSYVVCE